MKTWTTMESNQMRGQLDNCNWRRVVTTLLEIEKSIPHRVYLNILVH